MAEWQEVMDAREFLEWQEYFLLDPWGDERADFRAGVIAAVVANVNRGKGVKAFRPQDFMPRFARTPARTAARGARTQTPEQMKAIFRMFTIASGGTVNGVPQTVSGD